MNHNSKQKNLEFDVWTKSKCVLFSYLISFRSCAQWHVWKVVLSTLSKVLLSTNATTKSDSFSFIFLPSHFCPRQYFQLCGILRKNYMKSCKIRSMSVFSCLVLYLVTTWSDLLKMWVEVPRFEVQNVLKNRFIFNTISQKTSKLVVQKKTPKKNNK